MLYLFWKWSREKKLREFSSIRCLTFVIPLVSQLLQKTGALFILINEFCNRGRDRKWSFDTIFLTKKVSDQISTISLIKGSWKSSCQISLGAMHILYLHFSHCFSFAFLKQKWPRMQKCGHPMKEENCNDTCQVCETSLNCSNIKPRKNVYIINCCWWIGAGHLRNVSWFDIKNLPCPWITTCTQCLSGKS